MTWLNLLFLHWRFNPNAIRPLIPQQLELDTFDGSAWVGLIPFKMHNCEFAGFKWLPTLRNFYECNVRTYVRCNGQPGVWFFSLDAQSLTPVLGGRHLWKLNYIHSKFNVKHTAHNNNSTNNNTNHNQTNHNDQPTTHDYQLTRRKGPWPPAQTHIR